MARARNIKPGFFVNEDLIELPPLTRLLFIGLWTIADREGRLEDRPKRIKVQLMPGDNCDPEQMLNELQSKKFITRYVIGNQSFIQIDNFSQHQNPHVKEPGSTIPEPDKHRASMVQAQEEPKHSTVQATPITDSLLPITDSKTPKPPESLSLPGWLEKSVWDDFLKHRGKKFTLKAQELSIAKLDAMRRKGHDPTQVINNSIANGWKGLFEPKGSYAKPAKYDVAGEAIKRLKAAGCVLGSADVPVDDDLRGQVYEHDPRARTGG
jgi:hypothetical protein